jgi:hypothetical protein
MMMRTFLYQDPLPPCPSCYQPPTRMEIDYMSRPLKVWLSCGCYVLALDVGITEQSGCQAPDHECFGQPTCDRPSD